MRAPARRALLKGYAAGLSLSPVLGPMLGPVLGVTLWPSPALATDEVVLPPAFEATTSASGKYVLELKLRAASQPHAARATASFWEQGAASRKLLWTRELAHRPRPRFVVVGNGGQVVLLDEWLNVRSELAVSVVDKHNRTLAVHNLEAVRAALDVPIGALAPRARHGVWMQAPPALSAQGDAVEVAAADRVLVIQLRDGALFRR